MKFRARIPNEQGELIEQEFELPDEHPLVQALPKDISGLSIYGRDT